MLVLEADNFIINYFRGKEMELNTKGLSAKTGKTETISLAPANQKK